MPLPSVPLICAGVDLRGQLPLQLHPSLTDRDATDKERYLVHWVGGHGLLCCFADHLLPVACHNLPR